MKKICILSVIILIVALMAAGVLAGCDGMDINMPDKINVVGNGEAAEVIETLENIEYKLLIKEVYTDNGKLAIGASEAPDVKVAADRNIMDSISVTVAENVITIRGNGDYFYKTENFAIDIGAKVSDIQIDGAFELDISESGLSDFKMEINGACKGDINVGSPDSFRLVTNGAGGIEITGGCDEGYIELNGAGSIEAFEFAAVDLDIVINGAGSMNVWASGELNAAVNGVGKIVYDGNPATVNKNVSGLGSIKAK